MRSSRCRCLPKNYMYYAKRLIDSKLRAKRPCFTSCFVNKTSEACLGHDNSCVHANFAQKKKRNHVHLSRESYDRTNFALKKLHHKNSRKMFFCLAQKPLHKAVV